MFCSGNNTGQYTIDNVLRMETLACLNFSTFIPEQLDNETGGEIPKIQGLL